MNDKLEALLSKQDIHELSCRYMRGLEDLIIAGRYLDRYERRDDVWKIAYRSEVVDWTRSEPVNEPYFEMAPDCLRGGRQDDAVFRRDNRYRGSKGAK